MHVVYCMLPYSRLLNSTWLFFGILFRRECFNTPYYPASYGLESSHHQCCFLQCAVSNRSQQPSQHHE